MSIDNHEVHGIDVPAAAAGLVGRLLTRPWGQVSPSVYETGRLVALAPWLNGHRRRVGYLLDTQRADGGWGAPDGYALVPTLSATDALLAVLDGDDAHDPEVSRAARAGLRMLSRELPELTASTLPDMPANDLIAVSLIESINRRQAAGATLCPPEGMDGDRLAMVREALRAGITLPEKVLHALEVADDLARGATGVRVETTGTVGASPAATAAWLDGPRSAPGHPARRFLETVVADHDGLVPCGIPITAFERGWVLSGLARAGIDPAPPAELVKDLGAAVGPAGAPAAAGLPADADTTSVAVYSLALLGVPVPPDVLWEFEVDGRFCTWPGEQGFSVSVNAHVLDAFGHYLKLVEHGAVPATSAVKRYEDTVDNIVTVLCDHQRADGGWVDRWHASPYYATLGCALALDEFGGGRAAAAVRRARRWVLDTQRPDGSWGRWEGTEEETAYALQILLLTRGTVEESYDAVQRGYRFILHSGRALVGDDFAGPALWHDKDLYLPGSIVRGTVLAALHLAQERVGEPAD